MIDIILFVVAFALLLLGIIGSFLPILPGPPLSYLGIILIHFSARYDFSNRFLWIYGIIALVITVVDYLLPSWGTKRYGGSKYGMWGAAIGLVLGLIIYAPIGIFVGPFLGAYIAELINDKDSRTALKSAFGSFLGIMFGVFLKFVFGIILLYQGIKAIILSFFPVA